MSHLKKILETIFILLTLSIVTLMFDLVHVNALTSISSLPGMIYYKYNNSDQYIDINNQKYNKNPFMVLETLSDKKISDRYPNFTGYKIPVYVKANEKLDYYVTTNSYQLRYVSYSGQPSFSLLGDDKFYTLYFRMYASPQSDEVQAGIFESYEIFNRLHFSVKSSFNGYDIENYKAYDCLTTSLNSDFPSTVISCRVPKKYLDSFVLDLSLDNRAFAQTDSSNDYIESVYYLYLSEVVNYDSDNNGMLNVTSSVSGSDVTLNFNATDDENVVGYYYTIGDYDYVYTTDKSVVLSGFSNGSFSGTAKAVYKDGSNTPLSSFTVNVTTSSLPVLRYFVTYVDGDIIVDLRDSYAISGTISKYYLKLDDGEWFEISDNQYTFKNVEFGEHTLMMRIVDSLGNVSTATYGFRSKSSNEVVIDTVKSFYDVVVDQFNNMWTDFGKVMKQLFVPSESELSNWFNDVNTSLTEQFGFLSYPFTWVITFLQRFTELTDTGSYIISWSDIKVPNFDYVIISKGSFDLASLLNNSNIKTMHDIYLMCIDALVILSFFNYCSNVYNRIFGNNDIYETDILSASQNYTIDDKQQLHKSVTASKTHVEKRTRKKV